MKIDIFDSFEAARNTWMKFQDSGELYFFQTYEWLESWYSHIGKEQSIQPCLVSIYTDSGEPLCFFPFGIWQKGSLSVLSWMGGILIDYGAPIISPAMQKEACDIDFIYIWEAVIDRLPPVDAIWLTKIPEEINGYRNPFCDLKCHQYHSNAHYVRLSGDWEAFYASHTSSRKRSKDRRNQRRLSEVGQILFSITDGSDEDLYREITRAMIVQKERQYRDKMAPNYLEPEYQKKFFINPGVDLLRSGRLHVAGLYVNNSIVATHWGFSFKGRYYYFMPSIEKGNLTKYSPGRLLLLHLFRWCLKNDMKFFDFTIGDEPYKDDWCDSELSLYQYFRPHTFKGKMYRIYYRIYLAIIGRAFFLDTARRIRCLVYRLRYLVF